MEQKFRFFDWFVLNWSRTTLPLAAVLLTLSPIILKELGLVLFLIFLQLPTYMIHQYEEHSQGKFKAYITGLIGFEALSDRDIFYINILFVWVLDLIFLYFAFYMHLWFGLIPAYMTAFNGISHIGMGLKSRKYNPGLWTSIFLFLPIGGYCIYLISHTLKVSILHHVVAFVITIFVHACIMIRVRLNLKKIKNK